MITPELLRAMFDEEGAIDVLHPRCAGLVVQQERVVACVRVSVEGAARIEVRVFATTPAGLAALADWLERSGCSHAAIEASGEHWRPIWQALSRGDMALIAATADQVKNVLGHKAGTADATWLADVLAHGLIRTRFAGGPSGQAMLALLRSRKLLVREQAGQVQRLRMTLEEAGIKLASVLTNIVGASGRAVLQALIDGQSDTEQLLALIDRRVKASPDRLRAALQGHVTAHRRFQLSLHLRQIEALDAAIADIDQEVDRYLDPFREAVRGRRARSPDRSDTKMYYQPICCR